jgi:hypothetical protein
MANVSRSPDRVAVGDSSHLPTPESSSQDEPDAAVEVPQVDDLNQRDEADRDRAQWLGSSIQALDIERDVGIGRVDVFIEDVECERDAELVEDQRGADPASRRSRARSARC